ncbi:MAG: hypothetical protein A2Z99_04225 [Treponema sp. GWB1_62_6]|nr:MAG: hypothetical protein A2Z99_04225 [Treponema sp. GWB1_62_6]OHE66157.1 MAG: hypothetical protein A2001_09885 [Treponema sp. GWC1_61_84]OHE71752.1 MAG: hypothetical protein A2413_04060 [Treponema sp. RIFOXYC1_FULL_61_9]HCM25765.1 Uma2 family endonuclease [Treponema sp.]
MGLPLTKSDSRFTYADYRLWPETERWELIDGIAWNMCAAPSRAHQELSGELHLLLRSWLKGKPCRVYDAPFDVLLPANPDESDDEVDTVVQPDLVVYCDRTKLTDAGARGAPDLVVEIISPWTIKKDLNDKFRLYERVGVKEYWVLDPAGHVQAYTLGAKGRYGDPVILVGGGTLSCAVLEGFTVDMAALFAEAKD